MRYQDLRAWQLAVDLAEKVYYLTQPFPAEERFGLVSQMRRSARSVYANIAEGFGRKTGREFVRFLRISSGSLFELESDLELTRRVKLITELDCALVCKDPRETSAVLHALIKGAEARIR